MVDRNNIDFWGVNMRIQPLQTVVVMHGLGKLRNVIKKEIKCKIVRFFIKRFKPFVQIPQRPKNY